MKNKLLISTALAAAFTVANAYAVEPAQSAVSDVKNWNDNIYELEENTSRGGGVLRPAADEKDLTAGKIGGNRITARQTSGHSGEVYAQGAVLWLGKKLSSVNAGEISNNGLNVTTENNNNAKATANGGAFAIYKGGYIDNLTANFTGNKASSRYTGEGEYNGTGSSAGGGAIHVEGQYGTDEKPASGKSTAISPATAPKERLMPTAAQSISKPAPIVTDRREPASLQPRLTATLPTTLSKRLQPTPQPKPRPAAQSR